MNNGFWTLEVRHSNDSTKMVRPAEGPVEPRLFVLEHTSGDLCHIVDSKGHLGNIGPGGVVVEEFTVTSGHRAITLDHHHLVRRDVEKDHLIVFHHRYGPGRP